MAPRVRYVKSSGVSIAWSQVGEGPRDLAFVPGFVSHQEVLWEEPRVARFFERLASFSRVILWDKREQGLSDRTGQPPTLEDSMDDLRAVLDAAASPRPTLFGISEGGPMELLFAATYPDRVDRLVVYGSYARLLAAPDFAAGMPGEAYQRFCDRLIAEWGGPVLLRAFAPTLGDDARASAWWGRLLRSGASPRSAGDLLDLYRQIDVRDVLPAIRVPTLVLHRRDDRLILARQGRYLAEHIADARYVELEGRDHLAFAGDTDALLDEIEAFATGSRPRRRPNRILATVLFEDIVDSTRRAADLGDRRWRGLLDAHGAVVEEAVRRYDGRVVKTLGDGTLAIFDGPARAIRSAVAIRERVRELGLDVRAGLHTGELEQMNGDVGGIAVHIGARVAAASDPGEVLVSRTVTDLVAGSGLAFADRGDHELKGVPGSWRLYAVEG
jgi:class 3 adenylate cyclase